MNESKKPAPWERQPKESAISYSHFTKFLELEHPRRNAVLAKIVDKSPRTIERASALYNWRDRAAAYDAHIWNARLKGMLKGHEKATEEQIKAFHTVRLLASRRIQLLAKRVQDGDESALQEMSLAEALRFLVDSTKMERLLYGEATDRVERVYGDGQQEQATIDFSVLSPEELEAVSDLLPVLEKIGLVVSDDEGEGP